MLWHNARLQTRILLGYGLMLALIAALAMISIVRSSAINQQIRQLSADVTIETTTGAHLASQVAATQLAIDRYLQQPQDDNFRLAASELTRLREAVEQAQTLITSPQQRARLDSVARQVAAYQQSFQQLSKLINTQRQARDDLNNSLLDVSDSLNVAFTRYLYSGALDPIILSAFVRTQRSVQLASLWTARLFSEQREIWAQNTIDDLNRAAFNLKQSEDTLAQRTGTTVGGLQDHLERAAERAEQYKRNLAELRRQHSALLDLQGGQLKTEVDAIAMASLDRLASTAVSLEQQGGQTQRMMLVALTAILLTAALFGGWHPRTITRPLKELAAATQRLREGDYAATVEAQDRSEIGQLAANFNHMTATLRQQREELLRQQATLADRNRQLEQALLDLRSTTESREMLAQTVRLINLPIIPILRQVILLPLIGDIDSERVEALRARLLRDVQRYHAQIAIIDMTGVQMVDLQLVSGLITIATSARLLGARCMLVGISPEVAHLIVSSGAEVGGLLIRADLQTAIEYAIRSVRA